MINPSLALPHLTISTLINIHPPSEASPIPCIQMAKCCLYLLFGLSWSLVWNHLAKDQHHNHPSTQGHQGHSAALSACTELGSALPADFPAPKVCSLPRGRNIP